MRLSKCWDLQSYTCGRAKVRRRSFVLHWGSRFVPWEINLKMRLTLSASAQSLGSICKRGLRTCVPSQPKKDVQMWEQFVCSAGQNAPGDFHRRVDLFSEEKRGFEKSSNLTPVKSFSHTPLLYTSQQIRKGCLL
jgi:hypothetical protein